MIQEIQISDIRVPVGRELRVDNATLEDSIKQVGLLNPITVRSMVIHEVGDKQDGYMLIAGLHRLEAMRSLGHEEIAAVVIELEDLKCDLVEIDENLIRLDIPVIDQADRMKRRQEIYNALGLSFDARGGDRKSSESKDKIKTETVSDLICFSDDTARKIGLTPRSIRCLIQISKNIAHDLKAEIRNSFLAFELRNLIKLARIKDPKEQRAAALAYISGEADTITVPKKRGPTKTERQQAGEDLAELLIEHMPADSWPQVCTYLKLDKATVTLSAFRKLQSAKAA